MTTHNALAVLVKIKPGTIDALKAKLLQFNDPSSDIETNSIIPFKKISGLHFARFVVLDEAKDIKGNIITPSLVFATDYDKPLDKHLDEVIQIGGAGLKEIFLFCEGFSNTTDIKSYLYSNRKNYSAFYTGTPYRSVDRINREAALHDGIEDLIDQESKTDKPPESLRKKITDYSYKTFPWISNNENPTLLWKIGFYASIAIVLPLLAVFLILVLIIGIIPLRIKEESDIQEKSSIDDDSIQNLVKDEDKIVQNQLTHLVDIKPGWFRLTILKIVLFSINTLAKYIFNKGKLGSIPSIHFARWIIIDEGRRLLFFSNFDGSWENYLGDFIDKASVGLTGVWSNTVGFPKAKFLILEGATDEQQFKTWTRAHQIPTQVWYSAYKLLSVQNINNNSSIREGLVKPLKDKQLLNWLKKF